MRTRPSRKIRKETLQKLLQLRDKVQNWIICHDMSYGRIATNESIKPCSQIKGIKIPLGTPNLGKVQGDHIYHMGQLCLSGSEGFCPGVKASQDLQNASPTFGAFYRSPGTKKDSSYTENKGTHFSRDMMLGMLAYFVKTKDTEAAMHWINFVEKNKKVSRANLPIIKFLKKYNICPLIGGESKADDRCALVADSWGLLYQVYQYLGLLDSPRISSKIKRKMKWGKHTSKLGDYFNATFAPGDGKSVFQASLVVNNILIRRKTGQKLSSMNYGTKKIAEKSRFLNPFFLYAHFGPTEHGAQLILKYCPAEAPKYNHPAFPHGPTIRGVNLWNRLSFFQTRQPWGYYQVYGGYDCLMVLNYYLNHKLTD